LRQDDAEISKDKIAVIDDPVSSMDSSVLFIVSALVRELIGVCFNNAEYREHEREVQEDYIKQIFILTHNVYFHREIT
jgi:wobble nucleotide-excising tRNase